MRFRLLMSCLVLLGLRPNSPAWAQRPVIHRIHATSDPGQDSVFRLGSTITLEVSGLGKWIRQREKQLQTRVEAPQARLLARDLVLYIGDAPLLNMPPLAVYTNEADTAASSGLDSRPTGSAIPDTAAAAPTSMASREPTTALMGNIDSSGYSTSRRSQPDSAIYHDKVVFQLRRDPSNARYWNVLYKSPWAFAYPGKIGLGYADQVFTDLYPNQTRNIRLELIEPGSLWTAGLAILLLGGGIIVLGIRSWLLRDSSDEDTEADDADAPTPTIDQSDPPYSLSRVQLAWWIFIIIGSEVVIYLVTGVMPDISTTSLILLGISAGTTVLSNVTTSGQGAAAAAATGPPERSRGFLTDLLSDEHGVCIHRLQKLIVSLVMGCFYIRTVYNTVATPEWTTNQTLLLGISSATYLGLKWQENSMNSAAAVTDPSLNTSSGTAAPAATPATPGASSSSDGSTAATDAAAEAAASPGTADLIVTPSLGSMADPSTGAVIQRMEDDMGPIDPSIGHVPSEQDTEQVPG